MGIRSMKVKKSRSLSFKLTIWYVVILGIITCLAGLLLYQGYKRSLLKDVDETVFKIAENVSYEYWKKRGVTWENAIQKAEDTYNSYQPFIQVIKFSTHENSDSFEIISSDRIKQDIFFLGEKIYRKIDKKIDDHKYLTCRINQLISSPLRILLLETRGPYLIQVGLSLEKTLDKLRKLRFTMIISGVLLLLFASAGGNLIIRRALLPMKKVVQTAQHITTDDLSLRIQADGRKDEIGALIETFNNMIARLEKSVKKIKQFSGDVSHELRTPLTIIRGEVEVALRKSRTKEEYLKVLNSVLEESKRMEKIIDDLLFLSRIEATTKQGFENKIRLDELLIRVCEERMHMVEKKEIKLETAVRTKTPLIIEGDRNLLERMFVNIIDNAVRYTQKGGQIKVKLEKKGQEVKVQIEDNGIGIPEESLPYIFDRFFVVDSSRSKETGGVGLGLSIVKSIAEVHGAQIGIKTKVGKGTTFIIIFS